MASTSSPTTANRNPRFVVIGLETESNISSLLEILLQHGFATFACVENLNEVAFAGTSSASDSPTKKSSSSTKGNRRRSTTIKDVLSGHVGRKATTTMTPNKGNKKGRKKLSPAKRKSYVQSEGIPKAIVAAKKQRLESKINQLCGQSMPTMINYESPIMGIEQEQEEEDEEEEEPDGSMNGAGDLDIIVNRTAPPQIAAIATTYDEYSTHGEQRRQHCMQLCKKYKTSDTKIRCLKCQKMLAISVSNGGVNSNQAMDHMYTHLKEPIYVCKLCTTTYTSTSGARGHVAHQHRGTSFVDDMEDQTDRYHEAIMDLLTECYDKGERFFAF